MILELSVGIFIFILLILWIVSLYRSSVKWNTEACNWAGKHGALDAKCGQLEVDIAKLQAENIMLHDNLKAINKTSLFEFDEITRTVNNRQYYYKLNHAIGICLTPNELRQAKEKYNRYNNK